MNIQSGMIKTIAVTVIRRVAPPKPYLFDPATTTSSAMNANGCPATEIHRAIVSFVIMSGIYPIKNVDAKYRILGRRFSALEL